MTTLNTPPLDHAGQDVGQYRPTSNIWLGALRKVVRNRMALTSLVTLIIYFLVALAGIAGAFNSVIDKEVGPSNNPPAFRNADGEIQPSLWLGTDLLGKPVLWRFLYGARVALLVAVPAALLTIGIGTLLGLTAGFFGGWVDSIITWLFTTVSSIPAILLLLSLAYALRGVELPIEDENGVPLTLVGIPSIIIALSLTSWVGLCRLIRGETLKLREQDYVVAARAVGVSWLQILLRHILPNVAHLMIITFSLSLAAFVQAEVILSFLGLGVADQPSWGRMIDAARLDLLRGVWWRLAAATMAIFVFSLAVNVLGDALRDALDPRIQGSD